MRVIILTDQFIHSDETFVIGGWMQSLIHILERSEKIELAVAGLTNNKSSSENINGTLIYKIEDPAASNRLKKLYNRITCTIQNRKIIQDYVSVIADFNPDVVFIFGVENFLCSVIPFVKCKVVVHLQGLLNPYLNAFFPPNISKGLFFARSFNLLRYLKGSSPLHVFKVFRAKAKRELKFLSSVQYFMGRTEWDKTYIHVMNNTAEYFHVEEALRPDFYAAPQWQIKNRGKKQLISILSAATYKGFDVILKTAAILKSMNIDFEWKICGTHEDNPIIRAFEKIFRKKFAEQHVVLLGQKPVGDVIPLLLDADLFIHPSYIDNSPNSVCEAQILGMPVIATYVGGVPSLIEHGKTGMLIPANDPYSLSGTIKQLLNNPEKMKAIGLNAHNTATTRHDPMSILLRMEQVLQEIIDK